MNATLRVAFGHPPIELPSESVVDANLAVTVVFTTLAPICNGIPILVVLFSKQLRSQPYHWLLANYLLSCVAVMFGFGIYRIFQIQNYRYNGFMKNSEETDCGVAKFFEFPLMTGKFCLFLLGCERCAFLQYNRPINWFVLLLFLAMPWTLGIYRYSFELFTTMYLNIPYVGLCIDISSEKEEKRNLYTILNVAVPLCLALISILLAYYKTFVIYKNASVQLRGQSFTDFSEEAILLQRKKYIRKVIFRSINLAAALLGVRVVVTTITSSLFSQFSGNGLSQDNRDIFGTIGVTILYLETVIIPFIYLAFDRMLQEALTNILFKLIKKRTNINIDAVNQEL